MSKIFFDVFPTLKVNDEIRMLFESVQVEKVSTNRQRDFINVFLRILKFLGKNKD